MEQSKRTMVAIKLDGYRERNLRIIKYLESIGGIISVKPEDIVFSNVTYLCINHNGYILLYYGELEHIYTIIELPEESKLVDESKPVQIYMVGSEMCTDYEEAEKKAIELSKMDIGSPIAVFKAIAYFTTSLAPTTKTEL